ncbi:MAG: hypothetical protein ACOCXI_10010 [Chloroflexota bacterium]
MKDTDVVTTRRRRYLLAAALLFTTFIVASIYLAALAEAATPPLRTVLQAPLAAVIIPCSLARSLPVTPGFSACWH